MPPLLSMALGSAETTLLRMTTGYAMLVNGGKRITPTLIDRIQDRHGVTVYRHDTRDCPGCRSEVFVDRVPELPDERETVADPRHVYQVVSMLQGVVERGTGRRIQAVGKPLAGKTGTTNDSFDSWFVGFSPDLAVGVFVGFDEPRTLGPRETGSSVAAPVFKSFMEVALENAPATPFRVPPGISLVRINTDTGQPARVGDSHVILEAFLPGTEPTGGPTPVIRGYGYEGAPGAAQGAAQGGPYGPGTGPGTGLGTGAGYGGTPGAPAAGGSTLGVNNGYGAGAPAAPAGGGGNIDSGLY
jgi:penicillin-binding protein 1A